MLAVEHGSTSANIGFNQRKAQENSRKCTLTGAKVQKEPS
jgi:hypothetical protein